MKKVILNILVLAFGISAHAQMLTPTVIASAGAYATGGGVSLSYTVGELAAIQTFTSPNVILTQGFQQPNDIVSGLIDVEQGPDGAFSVYPIPAHGTLWFGYEFNESGKVQVSLMNILGQIMDYSLGENYTSGKFIHSFDCSSYASGNYILSVKFTTASGQEKILSKKVQFINN